MENQKLTLVVKILVKSEHRALVKNELLKLIDTTREEKGCLNYDLHQDIENKNLFFFYENWKTRILWEAHNKNTHIAEFQKVTNGLIEELIVNEMIHIK